MGVAESIISIDNRWWIARIDGTLNTMPLRLYLQLARATVCFGIICLAVANDEALIGALGPCPVGVDQANGREVTDYSYFLTDPKTTCRGKRCAEGEGDCLYSLS